MSAAHHITGKSRHVKALQEAFRRLAGHRRPCVVMGEAGVGKTFFAVELGKLDSQFHTVPVAQLTDEELDNALGPWTAGTVILENVESSSFRQQNLLLEFINRRSDDVRIIVTFSSSPEELHERHKLLDDLYAKVLTFESIEILPLRERPEDIPVLLRHFAPDHVIDMNGLELLIRRLWHGNIGELKTIVERCLNTSPDGVFRLPSELIEEKPEIVKVVSGFLSSREQTLDSSLDGMERGIIQRALARFGFDASTAAEFLGMKKEDLEHKVQRLGLNPARNK